MTGFADKRTGRFFDVVILGGTFAGLMAAYAAVKAGKTAVVVEKSPYLGGPLAQAAIVPVDIESGAAIGGFAWHLMQRVMQREGVLASANQPTIKKASSSAGDGYNPVSRPGSVFTYPKTWQDVADSFARSTGAVIVRDAPLETEQGYQWRGGVEIRQSSNEIVCIRTTKGAFYGRVFVDAEEEGDLMQACANAGMLNIALGMESSAQYGESYAGFRRAAPVTYTGFNGRDGSGNPLYPLIDDPGTPDGGASNMVMAYSVRTQMRLIAEGNAEPFFRPPGYDPAKFLAFERLLTARSATGLSVQNKQLNTVASLYSAKPAYNTNNNGALELTNDLPNKVEDYALGTLTRRRQIIRETIEWTVGLHFHAATAAGVPTAVRNQFALWGYDRLSFQDNRFIPRRIYIREGVRLVSDFVITQGDLEAQTAHPDGIAKISYDFDVHEPYMMLPVGVSNQLVAASGMYNSLSGSQRVPLRAIVPKIGQVKNLICAMNISCTHVAWAPIRMEPVYMQIGEAAGYLAAAAINLGLPVQNVPYSAISTQLTNALVLVT